MDNLIPRDNTAANLVRSGLFLDAIKTLGVFHVECVGADGKVKWRDTAPNVVTTQGKNAMLDKFLAIGTAYAAVYMGLHTTAGTATSTYSTPSPQVEPANTVYTPRKDLSAAWAVASAGVKALSGAGVSIPIIGSSTILGCFIVLGPTGISAVQDTAAAAAILFSSGAFTGGSRAVVNGDTLNITYQLTLT
jgi:hypothetical protein